MEHIQNNKSVREMLGKQGIKPKELPPAEDIKKSERRVVSDEKRIELNRQLLKLPKKQLYFARYGFEQRHCESEAEAIQ